MTLLELVEHLLIFYFRVCLNDTQPKSWSTGSSNQSAGATVLLSSRILIQQILANSTAADCVASVIERGCFTATRLSNTFIQPTRPA